MVAGRSLCRSCKTSLCPLCRSFFERNTKKNQKGARRANRIGKWASRRKQKGVIAIADSKADLPVLPEEILKVVILLLEDPADVARFSTISKHWYETIHSNSFWNMQPACARPFLLCLDYQSAKIDFKVKCSWRRLRELDVNFEKTGGINFEKTTVFSHGLLFLTMLSGEFWVINPFKAWVPKDVLVPPNNVLGMGGRIVDATFHSDLLTNSYIVILNVCVDSLGVPVYPYKEPQYHLAIYQSSTGKWSRSKSIEAKFSYQCPTCIGDTVYLVHDVNRGGNRAIYKYNSSEDSWSMKTFFKERAIPEFQLTQSKGKLLLVGQAWLQLHVWIVNEMKEEYHLTLLFVADNLSEGLCSFQVVDDLFLVTTDGECRIYDASTKSLLWSSKRPKGVQSYFISESSSLFLAGRNEEDDMKTISESRSLFLAGRNEEDDMKTLRE